MANQREADLDVLVSVKDFIEQFETPTARHEKAKAKYLKSIQGFIDTCNRQLEVYYAGLKKTNGK